MNRPLPPVSWDRYLIFGGLAIGGALVDLISKHQVFAAMGMPGEENVWWLWEGYIGIQTTLNKGALFGLGQGQVAWFAAFAVVAAVGIVYWLFAARAAHDRVLTGALGLIMGGILGNLYDRLGLWGGIDPISGDTIYAVRDWILFCYRDQFTWPNFNLADSFLVCGAGMLILHSFLAKPVAAEPAGPEETVQNSPQNS